MRKCTTFVQILCQYKRSEMTIYKFIHKTAQKSVLSCAILAALSCTLSCSERAHYVTIEGYAQGGIYSIKCSIPAKNEAMAVKRAEELKNGVDSILNVIDYAVSGYNKNSLLSRLNAGETLSDDSSAEYRVLQEMTAYCDSIRLVTDGAVDTRSAALFDIWGFGFKNGSMPSDSLVQAVMTDRSKMNFNAVAQGYSADLVAEYLDQNGVQDMLVNIGGEMICRGHNPSGKPWCIAIDKPVDGNNNPGEQVSGIFEMPMEKTAVVTSGNYRKFYIKDGVKYSHTVDPRTGYPVQHNLLSATIVAPTSAFADAMATYCMVIGTEKAKEFILGREDLEACLITDSEVWTSPGFVLK